MKLTKNQKEWIEIAAYIFLGYLIAVGANRGLAYGLNTDYPVVAVVSGSMEHFDNPEGKFYSFMQSKNFTIEQIKDLPFSDGMRKGDIVVVKSTEIDKIKVGDVIVYKFAGDVPIIHRVVGIERDGLITKGDNNNVMDEKNPVTKEQLKGKALLHIPMLGYVKIIYLKMVGNG